MKKLFVIISLWLFPLLGITQGLNHQWLLGYYPFNYLKARIFFNVNSDTLIHEYRKMPFQGTEATICDSNGNFIMSSNGVWIANSNNDTTMNGDSLNPGGTTGLYPNGLLLPYANIFLPYPGDSTKYILFHHTDSTDANSYSTYQIFTTTVDMTLDGGLGGVTSKNNVVLADTLNWGLAACKHANGRDWWIVAQKQSSDIVFKFLLTPSGVISVTSQHLNVPIARFNVTQPTFSKDGSKFAYNRYDPPTGDESVVITNFDRCTGMFFNAQNVPLTLGTAVWGLAFSPSGQYVYTCSSNYIFQTDVNTLTVDTVATFDGFSSPFPPFYTTFFNMYLAANGKIYLTSGNSTSHLHFINYPDSADTACDVQQHALYLDTVRHFRAVPNHPNYYLGCDTTCTPCLATGINNLLQKDFRFRIYPNPVINNFLNIGYLLPQNKSGLFQIYDITGKIVFKYTLPPWSNEQSFKLPNLSDGIYNCIVTSGNYRVSKKIAIIKE